jgi:hypothetical protein
VYVSIPKLNKVFLKYEIYCMYYNFLCFIFFCIFLLCAIKNWYYWFRSTINEFDFWVWLVLILEHCDEMVRGLPPATTVFIAVILVNMGISEEISTFYPFGDNLWEECSGIPAHSREWRNKLSRNFVIICNKIYLHFDGYNVKGLKGEIMTFQESRKTKQKNWT